jgi:hypothetical protein
MVAIEKAEAWISEPLSWASICARYPDAWVCLVEIEYERPNDMRIARGRVVGHGTTKRAPVEQAERWWTVYSEIGHFYTGRVRAPALRFTVTPTDEARDALHPR